MSEKLKRRCSMVLMAAVVLLSILAVKPDPAIDHDTGFIAAELRTVEGVDGCVTSTSYVNADGVVTDTIDAGFATVLKTRNGEGKVILERYLDAAGEPVARHGDYYGISYEYGEEKTVITYLDEDGSPVRLDTGYSSIVRTLVDGKASDDLYYDPEMRPVRCSDGYYGLHREYDADGQNSSISYLDRDGQTVSGLNGYAGKVYQRDENGVVIGETYFDEERKPVKASLGQYGERYRRNEQNRISWITYLDEAGEPAPNSAGYTILKRSYHRDGTVDTETYFDAGGEAMALSKGQYGVRCIGKVKLLLDKNGRVMPCVDNILNGFPFMVIVIGCIVCLLMLLFPRKASVLLTAVYVIFILYETLMFRENGNSRTNFVLFSYADRFMKQQSVRVGVIDNIWLFIPLGTGLYREFRKKWVLLVPFVMSVAIEATQYVTGLGIAEFDDVFGNTMGGWLGVLLAYTAVKWRKERKMERA